MACRSSLTRLVGVVGLLVCSLLQGVSAKLSLFQRAPNAIHKRHAQLRAEIRARPELKITHALPHELPPARRRRRAQETSEETQEASAWRPFRFKFDYRLDESRSSEDLEYMKTKLMPAIAGVISSTLEARVEEPPFKLPDIRFSNGPDIAAPPGVHDADMVVIVTSEPLGSAQCPKGTLAGATFLLQGEAVNRPVYGLAQFCEFSSDRFTYDLETGVHEMLHALGFFPADFQQSLPDSFSLVEDFLGTVTGDPTRGNGEFIRELDDGELYIVSPRVKEFVRAHFGCPSLEGAQLEDDGGQGSASAHWETRLFDGEMMDYAAENRPQHADRHVLTALSLAYFEDTGWYNVDYNYAGLVSFGYKAGCALAEGTYRQALDDPDAAFYLCDTEYDETYLCMHDRTAVGYCTSKSDPANDAFYRVVLIGAKQNNRILECASNGPGRRCLAPAEPRAYQSDSSFFPSCRDMSCSNEGKILIDGEACETTLGSEGWQCPDQEKFCGSPGWLTCTGTLNDCSTHGDCQEGRCYCHTGWGSDDCSVEICLEQCADGSACPDSGYCGVTRKPVETFEEHMQRVYQVDTAPVPSDYRGLADNRAPGALHASVLLASTLAVAAFATLLL